MKRAFVKTPTGFILDADSMEGLFSQYAQEVRVPLADAEQVVRATWYQADVKLPPKPPRKFRASLSRMVSGVSAVLNDMAGNIVSEGEARRRASICDRCPWKSDSTDCMSCGAYDAVRTFLKRSVPELPGIAGAGCGVCHCSCSVMVWARPEAFKEDAIQHPDRPDHCWIKSL